MIDDASAGAWNMAVDAAILENFPAGGPPTLRVYGWSRPTLSLGYFQRSVDRSGHAESRSVDVVRRATGGGAIVHDRELTYSLFVASKPRHIGEAGELYRGIHESWIGVLKNRGISANRYADSVDHRFKRENEPFLCFQRRTDNDLVVNRYKIVGSAQRRGSTAVLQHGSLLLSASPHAPQLPGLSELTSCGFSELSIGKLAGEFADALASLLGASWDRQGLTIDERDEACRQRDQKYANDGWTNKR